MLSIERDRWGRRHHPFLATHIARLLQKNKVPTFDIRDRYPNVFDLNVISEILYWWLSRREEKCYRNSVLLSSVTKESIKN